MLKAIGISKEYQDKIALNDVTLTFPDSGLVVIKGESGSGKSTLLNLLTALDYPTRGKIEFDGVEINAENSEKFRRKFCGNIYQDYMLVNELTVGENIALGMQASGEEYSESAVKELLKKVGIAESYADKRVSKLSGGEKQRVSIARAIAKKQAMIFADEPTGNLDSRNSVRIMDILKEISGDRLVIVVSHNEKLNSKYADYTVELFDGAVKNCDLPFQEEKSSMEYGREIDSASESKLPAKTLARMALWGVEKNKSKIVASIISFITICILAIAFTVGVISDLPFAYASSLSKSKNKDVVISLGSSFVNVDNSIISAFKQRVGFGCSAVYRFSINNDKFEKDDSENDKYIKKHGKAPMVSLGMAYNPDAGLGAEILYGDVPQKQDDVMLPYCFAKYMAQVFNDYKTDDLKTLIGREITIRDDKYSICGIFEEGLYYTDLDDVGKAKDEYEYFLKTNKMAQCLILAAEKKDFLYNATMQSGGFYSGFEGFYFNFKDVWNVYGRLMKIEYVGKSLELWGDLPMNMHSEGVYFTSEIYGMFQNFRYIAFLPLMIMSFVGIVAMGYVSFGFLISSKAKSYNILRSLGFGKKNIKRLLSAQVFTIIAIECILGIALGAFCLYLFGRGYIALFTQGIDTKLFTELILPVGYAAPLIVSAFSFILGGIIVHTKTKWLFAKSIMENKTQ